MIWMTIIGRILEIMEILHTYGGNFYEDWQNSHVLGEDYYENKNLQEERWFLEHTIRNILLPTEKDMLCGGSWHV